MTAVRWDLLILGAIILLLILAVIALKATLQPGPSSKQARPDLHEQMARLDRIIRGDKQSEDTSLHDPIRAFPLTEEGRIGSTPFVLDDTLAPVEAGSTAVIDYSDPTAGGAVPLFRVEGQEEEFLTPHFTIGDVSASDGAPYARISPKLVNNLEVLTQLAEAPIFISSGYRHPALNADPSVGGAARSQHMAGRAADIWSSEKTPGELAVLALAITNCTLGIGLGGTYIHIDMRDRLASWVYEDALMDEATFDDWVRRQCSTDLSTEPLSFADAARMAAQRSKMTAAVLEDALVADYRDVLAVFARAQFRKKGTGAVMLDLRQNDDQQEVTLNDQLSYVLPGSEEARQWNLDALIRSVQMDSYFVFAIIGPDGGVTMGAMSYELALSGDR